MAHDKKLNAPASFALALVSLSVASISKTNFADKLKAFINEAKEKSARLVLLPEYSIAPILEEMEGNTVNATAFIEKELKKLAVQYSIYICGGTGVYLENNKLYNKSFLVNPTGTLIYQSKINLIESEKAEGFSGGQQVQILVTPFVKMAICVCYDIEFPELVRQIVLQNVDLILNPSYTVDQFGSQRVQYCAQARAIENHIYIAKTCLVGNKGHMYSPCGFGKSALYSPIDHGFDVMGTVAETTANAEEILVVEVNLPMLYKLRQQSSTSPLKDYLNLNFNSLPMQLIQF